MSLGKQIKKYRLAHGWKLEDLSDRCGVEVGTISALEVRDSKRSEKAPAIAKALGLSLEQLLDEDTDWSPVALAHATSGYAAQRDVPPAKVMEPQSNLVSIPYWPFTFTQEKFRRLLNGKDIKSIDDYIKGLLTARDNDHRKSGNGSI